MGMNTNDLILQAESVKKSFQTEKKVRLEVLKSVDLNISRNKIYVIVGASGAGKSTLLHLLGGLDRPDSGKVIFEGKEIFRMSDEKLAKFRNRNIGFVFQFHHLLPEFTALENVAIPLMIAGNKFSKAAEKGKELLTLVGLAERLDHKPAALSGGEQQRIAVARALSNDPSIILADEPTGNLDSANSQIINELFVDLRNNLNKTLVIVTHNKELMSLADIVYEMKDGEIVSRS